MVVGIDFDNTLISYDEVFFNHALRLNLITPETNKNKKNVRDKIRLLPDGEIIWQKVQAFVYGKGITQARLIEGAEDFLKTCAQEGIKVFVVSHKTEYSHFDTQQVNLRQVALDWMEANHFFMADGLGLHRDQVYFEETRSQKIGRLWSLGCTHFIDDLEEVFLEKTFPGGVEKILFAPQADSAISGDMKVFDSWRKIDEYFLTDKSQLREDRIMKIVANGLQQRVVAVSKIGKGANSKVYYVTCPFEQFVAKFYFQHPSDSRDRLGTEFKSLSFLWEQGLRVIPRPVVIYQEYGCAFYEFINGSSLVGDISKEDINGAVDFLEILGDLSSQAQSLDFSAASAACFSPKDSIKNIESRLDRISSQQGAEEYDQLYRYLNEEFIPLFKTVAQWSQSHLEEHGISYDGLLLREYQTLSPSDFGFHNALRIPDGRIVFLDFEYFGWDDPAKMISDFLWHPAMNVKEDLRSYFVKSMVAIFGKDPHFEERLKSLFPLFGLMWCLIILNEFITADAQRRDFARPLAKNITAVRLEQLAKAKRMSERIKTIYKDFPYGC